MKSFTKVVVLLLGLSIMVVSCDKISGNNFLAGTWMVVDYELNDNGSPYPKSDHSDYCFNDYKGDMIRFDDNGKTGSYIWAGDFTYTKNGNTITISVPGENRTMTIVGKRLKANDWISIPKTLESMADDRVNLVLIFEKQ